MCLCKQSSVGMGVCHHQPTLQQTATCVCVCIGSDPGIAPQMCVCVCVFVHSYVRSRVGMGVWMCVRVWHPHSPSYVKSRVSMGVCPASSLPSIATCVCMCMYANIAECLQLHKAVILLLFMKQPLCIKNSIIFSYNYNIYITHQPFELVTQIVRVSCE